MSEPRFKPIPESQMDAEQRAAVAAICSGPRGSVRGPFHALLRSPVLTDRVRSLGDYIRFENSLPRALGELAIMVAARFWSAQYEWDAHPRLGREAGLDPSVADDIAEGRRPVALDADQSLVYDLCREILIDKDVSDATYAAAVARFGERGVVDLISTVGYYGMVSLVLNTARVALPADAQPLPPFKGLAK